MADDERYDDVEALLRATSAYCRGEFERFAQRPWDAALEGAIRPLAEARTTTVEHEARLVYADLHAAVHQAVAFAKARAADADRARGLSEHERAAREQHMARLTGAVARPLSIKDEILARPAPRPARDEAPPSGPRSRELPPIEFPEWFTTMLESSSKWGECADFLGYLTIYHLEAMLAARGMEPLAEDAPRWKPLPSDARSWFAELATGLHGAAPWGECFDAHGRSRRDPAGRPAAPTLREVAIASLLSGNRPPVRPGMTVLDVVAAEEQAVRRVMRP